MEQRHQDIIRTNYVLLADQIKSSVGDICAFLYQARIISERMKENILEGNHTPRQKAEALLDLIPKRGPSAFDMFYNAILESELDDAANILNPIKSHINLATAMPQSADTNPPPPREEEVGAQTDTPTNEPLPQSASSASASSSSVRDIPTSWPRLGFVKKEEIKLQTVQKDSKMYKDYFESLKPRGQRLTYTMQHEVRGRVLIINNEHWVKVQMRPKQGENVIYPPDRDGSTYDKENLETLFKQLGFEVKVYNDQTKKNMERIFQEECEKNHKDFDCFILIILTHGHKGIVFGNDGYAIKKNDEFEYHNWIKVKHIKHMFCSIKSLLGKPKLFFIQACRGDAENIGVEVPTSAASLETGDMDMDIDLKDAKDTIAELEEREEESDGPHDRIPRDTDYLLALSTVPGMVSWRKPEHGSWFIQALVYIFSSYAHLHDLNTLLTMTNAYVCSEETEHGKKQATEKKDSLRKLFYFFPGLHPALPPPS